MDLNTNTIIRTKKDRKNNAVKETGAVKINSGLLTIIISFLGFMVFTTGFIFLILGAEMITTFIAGSILVFVGAVALIVALIKWIKSL